MDRKLLCGLVLEAGGRGDRIPQRLRNLVEPIALAGNICHVLRLLFVDHSVPLMGMSPTSIHCEPCSGSSAARRPVSRGLARFASGAGAAYGFIDDVLRHLSQFAVFGLADRAQLSERLLGGGPAASPDQADRLIDHGA